MTYGTDFASWCDTLQGVLSNGPLPGVAAQHVMSPEPRRLEPPEGADHLRHGAVLVLIYPGAAGCSFPITLRSERMLHHRGQISLPGGMQERGDASLAATAARETQEEIGVAPARVRMLGRLTPLYVPASHSIIHPYVACAATTPVFHPNPDEVSAIIEMPLDALLDPAARAEEFREIDGRCVRVPFFRAGPHKVWGATAMILGELAALLTSSPALAHAPNHAAC